MLSENSVQEWIVDELEHLSEMQFRFLSLSPPENYVVLLSEAMHHFPPEKVFSGAFLTWRRDFEETQSMVKLLTPDRLVVKMSAKAFEEQAKQENWLKEPYYQTRKKRKYNRVCVCWFRSCFALSFRMVFTHLRFVVFVSLPAGATEGKHAAILGVRHRDSQIREGCG